MVSFPRQQVLSCVRVEEISQPLSLEQQSRASHIYSLPILQCACDVLSICLDLPTEMDCNLELGAKQTIARLLFDLCDFVTQQKQS